MVKEPNPNKKSEKKPLNNFAKYSGMAFQMIAVILIGVFGGMKLDEYIPLKFPIFTIILTILSVFASMYLVIRDFLNKK